jgi:hypothetical protein
MRDAPAGQRADGVDLARIERPFAVDDEPGAVDAERVAGEQAGVELRRVDAAGAERLDQRLDRPRQRQSGAQSGDRAGHHAPSAASSSA